MKTRFGFALSFLLCLTLTSAAWGQWSSDPAVNLPIADKTQGNDQVQPKLKSLPNGGWYISWFDSDPTVPPKVGYDVRLQHLDANGNELFPHLGIAVAILSNSSTQDYGLDIDTAHNALLAFLDTREGTNQQVTAAKIGPGGKAMWGSKGVQLTTDSGFHADPKITGTTDGDSVVAWTTDSNAILQRLDPSGNPLWGAGIVLGASGFNYTVSDLHAADNGSVIVSWVRDSGFGSNRQLLTNKFDTTGAPLWGAQGITLFSTGSLQFGNFPYFIPDGSGGAVFSWYTSSPTLQCFAQHVRSDGTVAFQANGAPVSSNGADVRVSPSVSYRASTDETFVFWTEEDSLQFTNGVSGQKFDGAGNTQWGPDGITLVPLGSDSQIFVENVQIGTGALVYWVDQASFTSSTIQATRLDNSGTVQCAQFPVSTTPLAPFGLVAGIGTSRLSALTWADSRIGNNAIYIQNVNRDCTLGGH